ncbi:hypothetical protein DJ88_4375 [Bacillus paralicheniformis]|nr:hypothetical protein DJ88_4375 [Bacillus paralicheniformis]
MCLKKKTLNWGLLRHLFLEERTCRDSLNPASRRGAQNQSRPHHRVLLDEARDCTKLESRLFFSCKKLPSQVVYTEIYDRDA